MQRKFLLTSAAVALVLGLAPAVAQVNSDRSPTSRDQSREQAAPQHEQNSQRLDQGRRAAPSRAEDRAGRNSDESRSAQERNERATTGENSRRDEDRTGDKARQTQRSNAEGASDATSRQGERTEPSRATTREDNDRNRTTTRESNERNRATRGENEHERSAADRNERSTTNRNERTTTERNERSAPSQERATERERGVNDRNASRESRESEQRTRVSASLDESHRSRLHTAIARIDARPVTNVDFSISVGTVVPRTVELRPLPASIVEIIPAYRDYDYFVVRNNVVIVEPETHKIVDVIARSSSSRAQVERKSRKVELTRQQREVIHKRYATRRHVTTGAGSQVEEDITVGERVPDTVVIRSFPEEIYQEVPPVRRYRYIERDDNIYLVDPGSRRVIEEID